MDNVGALVDRAILIGAIIAALAFLPSLVIFKGKLSLLRAIIIALLCSLLAFIISAVIVLIFISFF